MEADAVLQPTWWLYEPLQFLLPYCKKDKGKSNLPLSQNEGIAHCTEDVIADIEDAILLNDSVVIEGDDLVGNNVVMSPTSVASTSSIGSSQRSENKGYSCTKKRRKEEVGLNYTIVTYFVTLCIVPRDAYISKAGSSHYREPDYMQDPPRNNLIGCPRACGYANIEGFAVRDSFAAYFSTDGRVCWQDRQVNRTDLN
ncbi:hypothetical protein FQR65_LT19720 [Abscondita terminalis]|nr:hypothetical protein FQR65_LT19720 [Abscondita terminalis]